MMMMMNKMHEIRQQKHEQKCSAYYRDGKKVSFTFKILVYIWMFADSDREIKFSVVQTVIINLFKRNISKVIN